ncbi:hypothetical protein CPC08DRAFT_823422 [Agrocybe pediades]|nr:hypothetical protein CPC08DRAFT_823422 [Agrocybe pediades]
MDLHRSTVAKLYDAIVASSLINTDPMQFPWSTSSYALMSRSSLSSVCNVYSTDSLESPISLTTLTFPTIISSCSTVTLASDSSNDDHTLIDLFQLESTSVVDSKPKPPPHGTYEPRPSFKSDFNALISP